MVMVDLYIFSGFIASLFGFVLLYNLRRKIRKTKGTKAVGGETSIKTSPTAGGGLRKEDCIGDADIIIVGAGVAGAALAYTLGKVCLS